MADLAGGRYPQQFSWWNILGQPTNVINTSYPIRSNLEYLGLGGGLTDTAASLVSGVMTVVAMPVEVGVTISTVSVLVGASGASTPTHSFAALYSGTNVAAPPLIAQTADGTTTAQPASTRFDMKFTGTGANAPQIITGAQAPFGFIWVAVSATATTSVPSLITNAGSIAAAGQYQWFTNTLAAGTNTAFCMTSGASVGGTAPATLVYASQKLVAPLVFVS